MQHCYFAVVIISVCASVIGQCPPDFTHFADIGACLMFASTPKSFFDAREVCARLNSGLVRVTAENVATACRALMVANGKITHWTGLTDLLSESHYRWPYNEHLVTPRWGSYAVHTQPNDPGDGQNCVIADLSPAMVVKNTWQDKPCSQSYPYICERFKGDEFLLTGQFRMRSASLTTLKNVGVASEFPTTVHRRCATECLKHLLCDGYAYRKDQPEAVCFVLKLVKNSHAERIAVQNKLLGSHIYLRSG